MQKWTVGFFLPYSGVAVFLVVRLHYSVVNQQLSQQPFVILECSKLAKTQPRERKMDMHRKQQGLQRQCYTQGLGAGACSVDNVIYWGYIWSFVHHYVLFCQKGEWTFAYKLRTEKQCHSMLLCNNETCTFHQPSLFLVFPSYGIIHLSLDEFHFLLWQFHLHIPVHMIFNICL